MHSSEPLSSLLNRGKHHAQDPQEKEKTAGIGCLFIVKYIILCLRGL